MQKRGQVALFVIIGIVVVVVVGLIFLIPTVKEKVIPVSGDVDEISERVEGCFNLFAVEGLYLSGLQGGSINPSPSYMIGGINVGYGYYLGENYLPSIEDMERDAIQYASDNIMGCVDFSEYELLDVAEDVDVAINENDVVATYDYAFGLKKGDKNYKVSDSLEGEYNINARKLHGAALSLINQLKKDKENLYLDSLKELGVDVTYSYSDSDGVLLFILQDSSSGYRLMFANKLVEGGVK